MFLLLLSILNVMSKIDSIRNRKSTTYYDWNYEMLRYAFSWNEASRVRAKSFVKQETNGLNITDCVLLTLSSASDPIDNLSIFIFTTPSNLRSYIKCNIINNPSTTSCIDTTVILDGDNNMVDDELCISSCLEFVFENFQILISEYNEEFHTTSLNTFISDLLLNTILNIIEYCQSTTVKIDALLTITNILLSNIVSFDIFNRVLILFNRQVFNSKLPIYYKRYLWESIRSITTSLKQVIINKSPPYNFKIMTGVELDGFNHYLRIFDKDAVFRRNIQYISIASIIPQLHGDLLYNLAYFNNSILFEKSLKKTYLPIVLYLIIKNITWRSVFVISRLCHCAISIHLSLNSLNLNSFLSLMRMEPISCPIGIIIGMVDYCVGLYRQNSEKYSKLLFNLVSDTINITKENKNDYILLLRYIYGLRKTIKVFQFTSVICDQLIKYNLPIDPFLLEETRNVDLSNILSISIRKDKSILSRRITRFHHKTHVIEIPIDLNVVDECLYCVKISISFQNELHDCINGLHQYIPIITRHHGISFYLSPMNNTRNTLYFPQPVNFKFILEFQLVSDIGVVFIGESSEFKLNFIDYFTPLKEPSQDMIITSVKCLEHIKMDMLRKALVEYCPRKSIEINRLIIVNIKLNYIYYFQLEFEEGEYDILVNIKASHLDLLILIDDLLNEIDAYE